MAAVTVALMAFMQPDTPDWLLATLLFVSGAARSVGFTAYNTIAFADVAQAHADRGEHTVVVDRRRVRRRDPAAALLKAGASATTAGPLRRRTPATFIVIAIVLGMALVEALLMSPSAGEVIRPMRRAKS
ncbi:MAG: hypothetical protein R2742_08410 [Micropruina glycogenica]